MQTTRYLNRRIAKAWRTLALLVTLGACCASISHAQPSGSLPQPPQDVEAFKLKADKIMTALMQERHIPGAVLIVVRDGRVALSAGYGYADLEKKQ